jgi:hypothetical protein
VSEGFGVLGRAREVDVIDPATVMPLLHAKRRATGREPHDEHSVVAVVNPGEDAPFVPGRGSTFARR